MRKKARSWDMETWGCVAASVPGDGTALTTSSFACNVSGLIRSGRVGMNVMAAMNNCAEWLERRPDHQAQPGSARIVRDRNRGVDGETGHLH